MIWSILLFLIVGLIGGAIAKAIVPGRQGGGILATMLLGVAGAIVGGFLGRLLFGSGEDKPWYDLPGLVASILGSIILLLVWGFIQKRSTRV